ncbi:MAG TPA: hypothetical protein VND91_00420 [Candidatus Saccharimonadia bacterium]|nr:hypothetical protein [Candidatus Saccharimonadia bacterium]
MTRVDRATAVLRGRAACSLRAARWIIAAAAAIASTPGVSAGFAGVGEDHSCAITLARTVECSGHNGFGQLGIGTIDAGRASPVEVRGLTGVVALAAGFFHTCALTQGGGVKCWGYDGNGELGDGTVGPDRGTVEDVVGLTSGVVAIAAGEFHTCAITSTGGAKCWGTDGNGQLGDGTSGTGTATPQDVATLASGVVAIAAGQYHTCAVTSAGGVKCWGDNTYGQVGVTPFGTGQRRATPTDVPTLASGVAGITAGAGHTCALTSIGGVKCWGSDDDFGELGDGVIGPDRAAPADVSGLTSGVAAIFSGGGPSTCALTNGGGVQCWGNNAYGQLGNGIGPPGASSPIPVGVVGLASGVLDAAAGFWDVCALLQGGVVMCWGRNNLGQLADGTIIGPPALGRSTPSRAHFNVAVAGRGTAFQVASRRATVPEAGERFGANVAVSDSVLAVAAPGANGGNGEVLVFDRTAANGSFGMNARNAKSATLDDAGWPIEPSARLVASPDGSVSGFGKAVALSRDGATLVVGAPGTTGSALLYRRAGASWGNTLPAPSAVLVPTPTAGVTPGDFGAAVAIDADGRIVVGAPASTVGDQAGAGSAYVFADNGSAVTPIGSALMASAPQPAARFGAAVAIDATVVAIGAPMHDGSESDSGAAYVFVPSGPAYAAPSALACVGGGIGDKSGCGAAIGIRNGLVVVGAPGADAPDGGTDAGHAEVFASDGGTFARRAILEPMPGAQQGAGGALAMNGDAIVLGAPLAGDVTGQGRGYLYEIPDAPWIDANVLPAGALGCACNPTERFAQSVAVSERYIVAGAPLASVTDLASAGRVDVFVFDRLHANDFE